MNWAHYRKAIVAALAAAAVIAAELPPDAPSWLTGTFAVLGALGVYFVRNAPQVRSRSELIDHLPPPTRAAHPSERGFTPEPEPERPRRRRPPDGP